MTGGKPEIQSVVNGETVVDIVADMNGSFKEFNRSTSLIEPKNESTPLAGMIVEIWQIFFWKIDKNSSSKFNSRLRHIRIFYNTKWCVKFFKVAFLGQHKASA